MKRRSENCNKYRGRLKKANTPVNIFKALPPNSDPALGYIHEAIQYYGYDPKNRLELPEKDRAAFRDQLHKRIADIGTKLLPGMSKGGVCRMFNMPAHTLNEALGHTKISKKCDSMRLLLLNLMVHVLTVRDMLADDERELWALWLQTNDPRAQPLALEPPVLPHGNIVSNRARKALKDNGIEPPPLRGPQPEAYKRKAARKKRLEAIMKQNRPLPQDAMLPQVLPFRALALLGVEASNKNPYAVKKYTAQEQELRAIASELLRKRESTARAARKAAKASAEKPEQTYDPTEPDILTAGKRSGVQPKWLRKKS